MIWFAPVVPIEMSAAVEPQDEDRRSSGNLADVDALQIPVLERAPKVNRSRQPSEREGRHSLASCSVVYCLSQSAHNRRPTSCRKLSVTLPKTKMKRDTTPMRVLLVGDSSMGQLGPMFIKKGGGSDFCCKMDGQMVGFRWLCTSESAI